MTDLNYDHNFKFRSKREVRVIKMPKNAVFETSMGSFTVELYTETMPITGRGPIL